MKVSPYKSHHEATVESFRKDPDFAAAYVNAVLNDGDQEEFLDALRYLADAGGGVSALAADASLNPTSLYRALSTNGNPELKTLQAILRTLGLQLAVTPIAIETQPISASVTAPTARGIGLVYSEGEWIGLRGKAKEARATMVDTVAPPMQPVPYPLQNRKESCGL
jgi:probable addiction module antidote protein